MQSIPGILLDRVGIVLEIIAFFFVTPELLGNERLITIAVWFSARLARVNAVLKPIARTMSPRFLFGVLVFILLAAVVTAIFQGASGSNELHQT